MNISYRMSNRVQDRLKDILKKQIMGIVMDSAYFYLDRKDFVDTFEELIAELNKSEPSPLVSTAGPSRIAVKVK